MFFSTLNSANASLIENGSFDNDLSSWVDASSSGTVSAISGAAVLSTGDGNDPFSSALVQGDDGLFSFLSPLNIELGASLLSFDRWLISNDSDATESGTSLFRDALNLSIYDANDFSFDMYIYDIDVNSSMSSYELDLSSFIGRDVAVSFELADENDGFNLSVAIDNVHFKTDASPSPIPEPSQMLLALTALILLKRGLFKRNLNL